MQSLYSAAQAHWAWANQVLPFQDMEAMEIKGYSAIPKAPELREHGNQIT